MSLLSFFFYILKSVSSSLGLVAEAREFNSIDSQKVIIDFAHTPDALDKSLIALKKQFNKKIILVFGCGGERDKKKRFQMGLIAKNHCRKVFVTDDNPRNENPEHIRRSIMRGCGNIATSIQSRKKAIETAIKELESDEILLVAEKDMKQHKIMVIK